MVSSALRKHLVTQAVGQHRILSACIPNVNL